MLQQKIKLFRSLFISIYYSKRPTYCSAVSCMLVILVAKCKTHATFNTQGLERLQFDEKVFGASMITFETQ